MPVTQPGGTSTTMSEGPLRVGLIPRRVEWPFKKPVFYLSALLQASRSKVRLVKSTDHVKIRHKTTALAGGNGVWAIFSKGR